MLGQCQSRAARLPLPLLPLRSGVSARAVPSDRGRYHVNIPQTFLIIIYREAAVAEKDEKEELRALKPAKESED